MADISANITKSLQGLSNIPVGDLAAGIQQFSEAVAAGSQTIQDNNVTGRQYNQILKAQAEANKQHIKNEKTKFKEAKRKYKEENTLWQRATKQNKEHLKAQSAMIKGMKTANRELTMYGRAQSKLMGGLQKAAGGLGGGITKLAGKAGALGGVIIGLKMLVDRFLQIDGILGRMSKQFGTSRKELRVVTNEAKAFARQMMLTGTSTREIAEMSASIMGNLSRSTEETRRLAGVATLVSKAFNVSQDDAAKFFATLAETTTLTADETKKIFENMKNTAAVGVNVGRAVRDLAANSTLIAIQGEKQVKNMAQVALYAAEADTDMQGITKGIRAFADLEQAVELSQRMALHFGVSVDATEMWRIAQRNNIKEMGEAHKANLLLLQSSTKIGENMTLGQMRVLEDMDYTAKAVMKTQTIVSAKEQKAAKARAESAATLNQLVTEQAGIWGRIQNIFLGPINTLMDEMAGSLEEGGSTWLSKLEADMMAKFDGKKLQDQMNNGDWAAALRTAFAPLTSILKDIFEEVLDWFMENYEVNFMPWGDGISRKTPRNPRIDPNSGIDTSIVAPQALGGVHGRGRAALVGEAGGEVVISRSALRSGIGVSGRAASALGSIGVPGYQYGADMSGTRTARQTGSVRSVRAQQAGFMSNLQNAPLKEFQESVYQFKLSAIAYTEAMKANIQQQRKLPKQLIAAVNMGIKAIGGAVMGESGSSMLNFMGGGGETMKYMGMFNKMGAKGGAGAIGKGLLGQGKGLLGQLGFAAKGKYVNSPTLMMVGEEGRGEVVIPTERIRKGLPINAGVARELGSIGVPGFMNGGFSLIDGGGPSGGGANKSPGFFGKRYGKDSAFQEAGGFKGAGRMALGQGAMQGLQSAFNTFQQGGNSDQVVASGLTSGISTGIGMGATALLAPLGPFAPMLGGLIGSSVGKLIAGPIAKLTGASDHHYGKYRKRSMKLLKSHIASNMPFEPGIPARLGKNMQMAITGRYDSPTPGSQAGLKNALIKNFPNLNDKEAISFINLMLGSESNPRAYSYFNRDFGLPQAMEFAKGGVVNRATNAIIGEAGPEAVVPLENSELVREMREIRKATQQLVRIIGDGKTTINLDGRILAESTGLNMYKIAQGG